MVTDEADGETGAAGSVVDRPHAPPLQAIAAKLPHLPDTPGVYLWKDADGRVLYVGKAKNLRSRLRSYFGGDPVSAKNGVMLRHVADFETIVVPTEAHAL